MVDDEEDQDDDEEYGTIKHTTKLFPPPASLQQITREMSHQITQVTSGVTQQITHVTHQVQRQLIGVVIATYKYMYYFISYVLSWLVIQM